MIRTNLETATPTKRTRRVYVAGRNFLRREPRPCSDAWHAGPYLRSDGQTAEPGHCAACGAFIEPNQVRRQS